MLSQSIGVMNEVKSRNTKQSNDYNIFKNIDIQKYLNLITDIFLFHPFYPGKEAYSLLTDMAICMPENHLFH